MAWQNLPSTSTPLNATNLNAIVESGSNTNGSYVKYQDGTILQCGTKEISENASNGSITYPIAFIDTNYYIFANQKYTSGSGYGGSTQLKCVSTPQGTSTTAGYIYNVYGDGTTPNFKRQVNWFAMGKWK